jgi:hypothetical protein
MHAANDNTPEMPVDLADYLAQALYRRNAKACDLIGGANAKIFEDALTEIYRLHRARRRPGALPTRPILGGPTHDVAWLPGGGARPRVARP